MRVRLLCPLPVAVAFCSADIELALVHLTPGNRWELQARRQDRPGYYMAGGPWRSEADATRELFTDGFVPPDEGTPPAVVFRRLIATGRAARV